MVVYIKRGQTYIPLCTNRMAPNAVPLTQRRSSRQLSTGKLILYAKGNLTAETQAVGIRRRYAKVLPVLMTILTTVPLILYNLSNLYIYSTKLINVVITLPTTVSLIKPLGPADRTNNFKMENISAKLAESHPFEGSCKFPILSRDDHRRIYEQEFSHLPLVNACLPTNVPMLGRDRDGYFYQHDTAERLVRNSIRKYECRAHTITLKANGEPVINDKNGTLVPKNQRFRYNANNFIIRCLNLTVLPNTTKTDNRILYEKAFGDISDPLIPLNTVRPVIEMPTHDEYGFLIENPIGNTKKTKLNLAILAIAGASRTQFARHMPRTMDFMIAKDSVENFKALLMDEPMGNNAGTVISLFERAKNRNCSTMLLDDTLHINSRLLKLLNIPTKAIDYDFDPFIGYNYQKWKKDPSMCIESRNQVDRYLDLWRWFHSRDVGIKNDCKLGFAYVPSTYEEAASSLEIRDHKLRTTLETMYIDGVFNDSIVILMGDHDDHQQHASSSIASYVQPAEMQTPLMSIHIPSPFRMHHPKQWEMVQLNRNRLTSTYDLRKTLLDLLDDAYDPKSERSGPGISLLKPIPPQRECSQAHIEHSHCTCMVERGLWLTDPIRPREIQEKSIQAFNEWTRDQAFLDNCLKLNELRIYADFQSFGIVNGNSTGQIQKFPVDKVLYHEFPIEIPLNYNRTVNSLVRIVLRIRNLVTENLFDVNYEPMVQVESAAAFGCSHSRRLASFCQCLHANE